MQYRVRQHLRFRRPWLAGALFGLFTTLVLLTCSKPEPPALKELMELAPDLPRDIAEMLVSGADSTIEKYVVNEGIIKTRQIQQVLSNAIQFDTIENFVRSDSLIRPLMDRIREVEDSLLGVKITDFERRFKKYTPERRMMAMRIRYEKRKAFNDPQLTDMEKIERFKKFLAQSEEYDLLLQAAQCKSTIGDLFLNLGFVDSCKSYHRSALVDFNELEMYNMSCHVLGVMGSMYGSRGQIDSMVACWEESKRLARKHGIPSQIARMHYFYADHYQRQGRLSLSHELYNQALEICRIYSDNQASAYYLGKAMKFHADLGAWEIIARLLPQARAAEKMHTLEPAPYRMRNSLEISLLEARYLMAMERVEEAEDVFNKIKKPVQDLPWPAIYMEFLRDWAKGLLQNNRFPKALPVIYEGYQLSHDVNQEVLSPQFLLMSAKAHNKMGDLDASKQKLEMFEDAASGLEDRLQREWIIRDALRIEINLAEGNDHGAVKALEEGAARLENLATRTDAGVYGYLWLGRSDDIRQLLHGIYEKDPLSGYGIEFFWRNLYRLLDSSNRKGSSQETVDHQSAGESRQKEPSLHERLGVYAEAAGTRVVKENAVHCVYLLRNGEVWRWTCSRDGIRRDVLNISSYRLRELVSAAWEKMARDPGEGNTGIDPEFSMNLQRLSQVLLPPEVVSGETENRDRVFLISAHGFLARFPFETLNVGETADYVPLLKQCDIAYVRHTDQYDPGHVSLSGIVLAHARGGGVIRGKSVHGRDLENVYAEGETVVSLRPGSKFLHGDAATKANLLDGWEQASFVYFASHMIRDPEVPYLSLVPMADPGGQLAPEAIYLDMSDIRAASLNQCDVVVLSGCSSGAPYVGARNAAPSLGDAFLDAGAGVVVQTFWDIRDDQARELMSSFVKEWGASSDPSHMIRALCNVRRAAMEGPEGVRFPFSWAAYSIKVGRF